MNPALVLDGRARVRRAGAIPVDREVDEVAWLSRREALSRLDHESDRRLLLRALAEPARRANGATQSGALDLGSLVILDSRKAEEALPSALELISRAVASSSRHPARDARRA
jgi:hypothetical protein